MESIWWVFKQLFSKGLVYRGFKVMPYSTGCNTPLSNFESGQNYKDVVDPAGKCGGCSCKLVWLWPLEVPRVCDIAKDGHWLG